MAQFILDGQVRLSIIKSSLDEIKKILSNLEPSHGGFKKLNKAIGTTESYMENFATQTQKPFENEGQFRAAENTLNKMEESFNRIKVIVGEIGFSDLKIDDSQKEKLDAFGKSLEEVKKAFTQAKDAAREKFLSDDFNVNFLKTLDPKLATKNLDQIDTALTSAIQSMTEESAKADESIGKLETRLTRLNQISSEMKAIGEKGFSAETMPNYDQIFTRSRSGGAAFKTHYFDAAGQQQQYKPGEAKAQFLKYLSQEFEIPEEELTKAVSRLKEPTAAAIQKLMQDIFATSMVSGAPTSELIEKVFTERIEKDSQLKAEKTAKQQLTDKLNLAQQVQQNAGKSLSDVANANTAMSTSIKELTKSQNDYKQSLVNTATGSGAYVNSIKTSQKAVNEMRASLNQLNAAYLKQESFNRTIFSIKAAVTNFLGFNQVLNLTKQAVREALTHIKELDTVMNGIAIVTDMSTGDLWNQIDQYSTMAQKYGVTIQGAYEVSKIYYQQGLETSDVLTLTNETLKLAKISGLDYATTTDYMTTAIRGFKMEMSEAATVVDVYSGLAANTAVSQEELAVAMSKTASSMEGVGATFEESSAMIATMVAVTRESATNIGSAMKSIASRYGELTKDPAKLMDSEGEAMSFNKVDTALQSVGISMKTVDGQFRDFTDVIIELAEKWDTLDSTSQRYIATQFAGNRQQSRFLALVSNVDLLKKNINVAENSEDIGSLQALKSLDSLESRLNQLQVAYQQFYTTIGAQDVWKGMVSGATNVINTLNSFPKLFGVIPAGAISSLLDIISLLKNAMQAGISEIAQIWSQGMNQAVASTGDMQSQAESQGRGIVDAFVNGIRGGIGKTKTAWDEAVAITKGTHPMQAMTTVEGRANFATIQQDWQRDLQMFNDPAAFSSVSQLEEYRTQLNQLGANIEPLSTNFSEARQQIEAAMHSLAAFGQQAEKTGAQAATSGGKLATAFQQVKNYIATSKTLPSTLGKIATAFKMVSLAIDTSSRAGQVASGVLQGVGGMFNLAKGALTGDITSLVSGGLALYNAIDMIWETQDEKITRLTQEAEKLNNVAKQAQASEKSMQKAKENYEEAEKARYDSAESAKAYQEAVENLAEKMPNVVVGFDSVGDAIINTTQLELELANARNATAQATKEAAEKEYELKKEEKDKAKKAVNGIKLTDTVSVDSAIQRADEVEWNRILTILGTATNDSGLGGGGTETAQQLYERYSNAWKAAQQKWEYTPEQVKEVEGALKQLNAWGSEKDTDDTINEQKLHVQQLLTEFNELSDKTSNQATDIIQNILDIINEDPSGKLNQYFSAQLEDITQYKTLLTTYQSMSTGEMAANSRLATSWMQELSQQGIFQSLFDSSSLMGIVGQYLSSFATNVNESWSDYIAEESNRKDIIAIGTSISDWYNSLLLDSEQSKKFNDMLSHTEQYTANDFIDSFDMPEALSQALINWYTTATENYKQTALGIISSSEINQDDWRKLISKSDLTKNQVDVLREIFKNTNNLAKAGFTDAAKSYNDAAFQFYEDVESLLDIDLRNTIISEIKEGGITTTEGLDKLKEIIPKEQTGLLESVDGMATAIIDNYFIQAQSTIEAFQASWKDSGADYGKLRSGVNFSEALDYIQVAQNLQIPLALNDFIEDGDKLLLSQEKYEEFMYAYINQYGTWVESRTAELNKAAQNLAAGDGSLITTTFLGQLGLSPDLINDVNSNTQIIMTAITNALEEYTKLDFILKSAEKSFTKENNFKEGDFSALELNYKQLAELFKFGTIDGKYITEGDAAKVKDSVNKAVSSFISDTLSLGYENVKLDSYDYLPKGITINKNQSYRDFVEQYVDLTGKTTQEINDLIIQAIELDTGVAKKESIKDLQVSSKNVIYGTLDQLQNVADAFGVNVEDIQGSYIKDLDSYTIKTDKIDLSTYQDLITKAINNNLAAVAEGINKGLSGSLDREGLINLNALLEVNGIAQITELDFTETYEGIQLSQKAALELYNTLGRIDSLKAESLFDSLFKMYTAPGNGLENIISTTAKIAETQAQINALANSKTQEDAEQVHLLTQQLGLYQRIAGQQMTDASAYKFMDESLPDYLQGPVNFWESLDKMQKSFESAATDKYFGVEDFYNIVNTLNSMATESNTISFLGNTLDGNLTTASELIQKGFRALESVDGKGMISLESIGIDFAGSAADMADGVDSGIQNLAQSQIDMLDGMIRLLETVVAMEKLGDITGEDNKIDLGELMVQVDGSDVYKIKEENQAWANYLLEADPESDLGKAVDSIKINNMTLRENLQAATKGAGLTEKDATAFTTAVNALYQAYLSDNYDLKNVMDSVRSTLQTSGFEGTIEIGNMQVALGYGAMLTTTDGKWYVEGKSYDDYTEALKAQVLYDAGARNIQAITLDEGELGYQGQIIYKENASMEVEINSAGQVTYSFQGISGTSEVDVIRQWLKSEQATTDMTQRGISREEYQMEVLGKIVIPNIEVENEESVKAATREQLDKLKMALTSGKSNEIAEIAGELGVNIDTSKAELSAQELQKIASLFNIDYQDLILNAVITTQADEKGNLVLDLLLKQGTTDANVLVNAQKGTDETNLLWSNTTPIVNIPQVKAIVQNVLGDFTNGTPPESWKNDLRSKLEGVGVPVQTVEAVVSAINLFYDEENGHINPDDINGFLNAFLLAPPPIQALVTSLLLKKDQLNNDGISDADIKAFLQDYSINSARINADIVTIMAAYENNPTVLAAAIAAYLRSYSIPSATTQAEIQQLIVTLSQNPNTNPAEAIAAINDLLAERNLVNDATAMAQVSKLLITGLNDADISLSLTSRLILLAHRLELPLINADVQTLLLSLASGQNSFDDSFIEQFAISTGISIPEAKAIIATLTAELASGAGKKKISPSDSLIAALQENGISVSTKVDIPLILSDLQAKIDETSLQAFKKSIYEQLGINIEELDNEEVQKLELTLNEIYLHFKDTNPDVNSSGITTIIDTLFPAGTYDTGTTITPIVHVGKPEYISDRTDKLFAIKELMDDAKYNFTSEDLNGWSWLTNRKKATEETFYGTKTYEFTQGVNGTLNHDITNTVLQENEKNISAVKQYLEYLQKAQNESQILLSETEKRTLQQLRSNAPEDVLSLIDTVLDTDTKATETLKANSSAFTEAFKDIDPTSLFGLGEAMQLIYQQASAIMGLNWNDLVESFNQLAALEEIKQTIQENISLGEENPVFQPIKPLDAVQAQLEENQVFGATHEIVQTVTYKENFIPEISEKYISDELANYMYGNNEDDYFVTVGTTQGLDTQAIEYLNGLEKKVKEGHKILTQQEKETLSFMKQDYEYLNNEDLTGKYLTQIENIFSSDNELTAQLEDKFGLISELFASLDPNDFVTIAQAIDLLANSATQLADIAWEQIAQGLAAISSANIDEVTITDQNGATQNVTFNAQLDTEQLDEEIANKEGEPAEINITADDKDAKSVLSTLLNEVNSSFGTISINASGTANSYLSSIKTALRDLTQKPFSIVLQTKLQGNGGSTGAKGNIALAGGRNTLMGELGPELWVSNGHYYVAGQGGAEFVNLPDDAIVFNHKQTESLMKNGKAGRGKPVTNETKAISFAKGNIHGGPAQASAASALSALKQIRSMWQSLLGASMKDLASKGGGGGGGGGDKDVAGFIADVERWYNLLQDIAQLEKEINYEEALRAKIESDYNKNGKAYVESQITSLRAYEKQLTDEQELMRSQQAYFEYRRQELNSTNSPFSKFYEYDENGQIKFKNNGYAELAAIVEANQYGAAKMTPEEQYKTFLEYGIPEEYMMYSEGKEIKKEDYENEDEFFLARVNAVWDRMQSEQTEMQELKDSIDDHALKSLELEKSRNELLQSMRDEMKDMEDQVLTAIEEMRERIIKEAEDTRDAYKDTNQEFIDGLTKALDKERQMYENNQSNEELNRNKRQLAILQRSGGSASQIASLQQQIGQQEQDQYFTQQQQQIDAIQEASDLQIEKLDMQIDIMNEQLEFEKANGLLWNDVYAQLQKTPAELTDFISKNVSAYWAESPLTSNDSMQKLLFDTERYNTLRDKMSEVYNEDYFNQEAQTLQKALFGEDNVEWAAYSTAMQNAFGQQWLDLRDAMKKDFDQKIAATSDINKAGNLDKDFIDAANKANYGDKNKTETKATVEKPKDNGSGGGSGGNGAGNSSKTGKVILRYINGYSGKELCSPESKTYSAGTIVNAKTYVKKFTNFSFVGASPSQVTVLADQKVIIEYQYEPENIEASSDPTSNHYGQFKSGGVVDYTGPAMVHGSPSDPEYMLSAPAFKAADQFMNNFLDHKATLAKITTLRDIYNDFALTSLTNTTSSNTAQTPVIIENATVEMNVQRLANDYDARRAGGEALDEILKIARKTTVSSVRR